MADNKHQKKRYSLRPPIGDAALTAKPVKKASQSGKTAIAKAGEAQRREMARTRLKQQEGRLTAAQQRVVKQRQQDALMDQRGKVTTKRFKQSYGGR